MKLPQDLLRALRHWPKGIVMDPATASFLFLAKFNEFLCTPVGQKFADQVFKDGQDLRNWVDGLFHHNKS